MSKPASAKSDIFIFMTLLALLGLTIGAAYLDLGRFNWLAAMAISTAKALLIGCYFMHLKAGHRLLWIVAGAGCFWLGILILLSMTDYLSRSWLP